ncbi:2OG-Fe dioxygenase family protein [Roseomonas sp. NAR14]|uniref:2OG-Fe dioxygenase family protein n=1 Tax=Roseomonas acroporae TaxID=2937791 RepID=A0A9X1Y4R4_9PROT|nr:2OG-Fe dioxygenase family protein [Roseomonas acroporae]MCK8783393.1 2OG-Fe dioxygenase family protein [Roseomonas acroporae]
MLPFSVTDTAAVVAQEGFTRLSAPALRAGLAIDDATWERFARSWDDLPVDTYMADGGRYRRRRHAVYRAVPGQAELVRQPHQPHWQSLTHNSLNGGIERWFAPVAEAVAEGPALPAMLRLGRYLAERLLPLTPWFVEVHQFRILAAGAEAGQPTPEGVHSDGVDYVMIQMIGRHNVAGGETVVQDAAGAEVARFTLADPGEAVFLDDRRLRHGTSPVLAADPSRPAHRDVLVLTYRRGPPRETQDGAGAATA